MATKIFNIKGMDCNSCAAMIELDLEEAGFRAKCDFAKETLEVDLKEEKDAEKIKDIIAGSGYQIS